MGADNTFGENNFNPSIKKPTSHKDVIEIMETDKKRSDINFIHVVPDSQFFTNLEMIRAYAISIKDRHLQIAIDNTIKQGYKLVKDVNQGSIH